MASQSYVKGLKYLIGDAIQYYRICKQKSYNGTMLRINMGCDIYPRQKNFWDFEADKTKTIIDKHIYEMAVYNGSEAREVEIQVKKKLEDIEDQCDPYRWYEEKRSSNNRSKEKHSASDEKSIVEEAEWNVEEFAIGLEYLSSLRQDWRLNSKEQKT